jgi:prevent-host-death family protein
MRTIDRTREDAVTEIALMKARERLSGLSRELRKNPKDVVRITHRGKPAMTLMSAELYDTLVETLDLLSDPAALDALRRSLHDIESGRVHTLDEVASRLGLTR